MKKPKCVNCNNTDPHRVIYSGFPLWLCREDECSLVWGFWSFIFVFIPFNGWFYAYDGMNYVTAMWNWMQGREVS